MVHTRYSRRSILYVLAALCAVTIMAGCATGAAGIAGDQLGDAGHEDGSHSTDPVGVTPQANRGNLVQTGGFYLELPDLWVVNHSPEADIAIVDPGSRAVVTIRTIDQAEYRRILADLPDAEPTLVGGMPATVDEASLTVLWESRPPDGSGAVLTVSLAESFNAPAIRRDVESLRASLRFTQVTEDTRHIVDLCAIRTYDTGWFFRQDLPAGVVFSYGDEPQLMVALRRLEETPEHAESDPREPILVSSLGPSLFGYYSVVSEEIGGSTSTSFVPLEPGLRWMFTILDPERRPPDDLLADERITRFFAAGVYLVP